MMFINMKFLNMLNFDMLLGEVFIRVLVKYLGNGDINGEKD